MGDAIKLIGIVIIVAGFALKLRCIGCRIDFRTCNRISFRDVFC